METDPLPAGQIEAAPTGGATVSEQLLQATELLKVTAILPPAALRRFGVAMSGGTLA
jgi:hypothetical protein